MNGCRLSIPPSVAGHPACRTLVLSQEGKVVRKAGVKGLYIRILVTLCAFEALPSLAGWSGEPPLENPYNEHEFLAACRTGHLPAVQFFLDQPEFAPDGQWLSGLSGHLVHGLFLAAQNGHLSSVQALIAADVNLDKTVDTGVTPLLMAVCRGHVAVVQALAEAGADVNRSSGLGLRPLMMAIVRNRPDMVRALLKGGARVNDAERDRYGMSPLIMAVSMGAEETVDLLLAAHADPDACGMYTWQTPLCIAAARGYAGLVDKLLVAGASARPVRELGVPRLSPLVLAASAGHAAVVDSLVKAGACTCDSQGPALTVASYLGHKDVVDVLLDAGVCPNVEDRWMTPLVAAASQGHVQIVETLIEQGAETDAELLDGTTPLFVAASAGTAPVVRRLLQTGVRTDKGASGLTPLFAALLGRHHDAQQVLVESEPVDLCQPCHGVAPVTLARIMRSRVEVVRALERAFAVAPSRRVPVNLAPGRGVRRPASSTEARVSDTGLRQQELFWQPVFFPVAGMAGVGSDEGCVPVW